VAGDILAFGPAETRDVEATSIPTLTTMYATAMRLRANVLLFQGCRVESMLTVSRLSAERIHVKQTRKPGIGESS
jgi:hypothetical protein